MSPSDAMEWIASTATIDRVGERKKLLAYLKALAYQEREIVLASGAKSNFYVDCRPVLLHYTGLPLAAAALHTAIYQWNRERGPTSPWSPAGSGLGGTLLASAMARHTIRGGSIHVRKEAKGHGTQRRVERAAVVPDGEKVVVVDDVATSGGSAVDVVDALRVEGYQVMLVAVLVDRQEGAAEALTAAGVPFVALFTPDDFR